MGPALADKIHDNRYQPYLFYKHPHSDPDHTCGAIKNKKQEPGHLIFTYFLVFHFSGYQKSDPDPSPGVYKIVKVDTYRHEFSRLKPGPSGLGKSIRTIFIYLFSCFFIFPGVKTRIRIRVRVFTQ